MERFSHNTFWLNQLLEREEVTDIFINGTKNVYIDMGNGIVPFQADLNSFLLSEESLREWIITQLSAVGKSWDAKNPFIDATLKSGHRMHVAFPAVSLQGTLLSLRRLSHSPHSSHASVPRAKPRWELSPYYPLLVQAIQQGDSLLISGKTGSGKTTLINDLLAQVPPHERMIALEDTPELCPHHPHFLSLMSRPPNSDGYGEVTLRNLLKQTLRMRPDRIILGECRGAEVLELLQTLNTGHCGALATIHANSAREALKRIELLCLLASQGGLPLTLLRELLALGIQWIVHLWMQEGQRKIQEVWKIVGKEGDTLLLRYFPPPNDVLASAHRSRPPSEEGLSNVFKK